MNQKEFGKTGSLTTPVAFGAMRISADESGVSRSLIYALEQGINFIDTARNYGESEAIVGKTLKAWSGEKPFIATKVKPLDITNWRFYVPLEEQFTPASIRESVETSLKTLGVDCLDLVQLHQWYYLWGQRPEWLETLQALQSEGKLRYIGVSAQDHEHDAVLKLVEEGSVDAVQLFMNVFESRPYVSILPLCEQRRVGAIIRCVFDHSGALAGAATREVLENDDVKLSHSSAEIITEYLNRVQRLRMLAQESGMSLAELSLRFALSHRGVSNLAVSLSSAEHVDVAVRAAEKGALDGAVLDTVLREHVWVKNFYYFSKSTVDGKK